MSATAESKRRELIVHFIGEPYDTDAEWQTLSERFVPYWASRLDECDIGLTAQRVRLDATFANTVFPRILRGGPEEVKETLPALSHGRVYCTSFGPGTAAPVVKDGSDGRRYVARKAGPPASCPP